MPTTPDPTGAVLALDVGDKRVGVARASLIARLPAPLTTLARGTDFFDHLKRIINDEHAVVLVVGVPRNLDGADTSQTQTTRVFIEELRRQTDLPIHLQDEALTSQKATKELDAKGQPYQRGDIDALAATYILEDFLAEHADVAVLTEVTKS